MMETIQAEDRQTEKGMVSMTNNIDLQTRFLTKAQQGQIPVTMFLMNGFQMRGVIVGSDQGVVILDGDGKQQVIYKHAISTIVPVRPIDLTTDT